MKKIFVFLMFCSAAAQAMENQRLERLVFQIKSFVQQAGKPKKIALLRPNPARIARPVVKTCVLASKFSDSDEDQREHKRLERFRKKLLVNLAPKKTDS